MLSLCPEKQVTVSGEDYDEDVFTGPPDSPQEFSGAEFSGFIGNLVQ